MWSIVAWPLRLCSSALVCTCVCVFAGFTPVPTAQAPSALHADFTNPNAESFDAFALTTAQGESHSETRSHGSHGSMHSTTSFLWSNQWSSRKLLERVLEPGQRASTATHRRRRIRRGPTMTLGSAFTSSSPGDPGDSVMSGVNYSIPTLLNQDEVAVFSHLPKTGGVSFHSDFAQAMQKRGRPCAQGSNFFGKRWSDALLAPDVKCMIGEVNVPTIRALRPSAAVAVVLREPLSHSLSALNWLHGFTNGFDVDAVIREDLRHIPKYTSWLAGRVCTEREGRDRFMQRARLTRVNSTRIKVAWARRLFRQGVFPWWDSTITGGLSQALRVLHSLWFVGVSEHYDVSVCLLAYQVGVFDEEKCRCGRTWHGQRLNGRNHTLELSASQQERARAVREEDETVYRCALLLFFARVRSAEERLERRFACELPAEGAREVAEREECWRKATEGRREAAAGARERWGEQRKNE